MRVFSTDQAPSREAFAYWREVLTQHFIHLRPERTDSRQFASAIEANELSGHSFSRVKAGAQNIHRGPQEIARSPHDLIFLNLHVVGPGSYRQGGDERPLRCGDIYFIDAVQPFQLGCGNGVVQLSLKFPRSLICDVMPRHHAIGGAHIDGRRRVGALIASYASTLWSGGLEQSLRPDAVDHLLALSALALNPETRRPLPRAALRAATYAHARRVIERCCSDGEFMPSMAASASGVPLRTLQAIFAEHGDSVSRRIQSARIGLAAGMLTQRDMRHRNVGEIALMAGFKDVTHFTHLFARLHGESPARWRRRRMH